MRRFESSRPSQAVRLQRVLKRTALEMPRYRGISLIYGFGGARMGGFGCGARMGGGFGGGHFAGRGPALGRGLAGQHAEVRGHFGRDHFHRGRRFGFGGGYDDWCYEYPYYTPNCYLYGY